MASAVARTFDLLGWFSPATLPAKELLRQAWSLGLSWDEQLPPNLQERWKAWVSQLKSITDHPIPRYIGDTGKKTKSQQLHGFSDTSQLAYGGAVYVRTQFDDDSVTIHLVAAKSKVAPLQPLTMPRLELCGALVLVQLLSAIAEELGIAKENIYAWTDAAVVLGWLNRPVTQLTVYVANRVSKLLSLVESGSWRYINT